jgi:hypothetical protein
MLTPTCVGSPCQRVNTGAGLKRKGIAHFAGDLRGIMTTEAPRLR